VASSTAKRWTSEGSRRDANRRGVTGARDGGTLAGPAGNDALSRTLYALHLRGGTATRAELTVELDRGRSAMGYLLGELRARHLVEIDPRASRPTGAGRPSHRVVVARDAAFVVAVHVRATAFDLAAVGIGGHVLARASHDINQPAAAHARVSNHAREPEAVLADIAAAVREIVDAQRAAGRPTCAGVGVAVPAPVRTRDGYTLTALHLGWRGLALRERLAAALPELAVAVGNDANLAALAEFRHGAGRGARQLLYLTTQQVGIGGGLISEGRSFVGANGYALEAGHIGVAPDGVRCPCGSRGCLEVEVDQRGLLRAAGIDPARVDVERVVAALLTRAEREEHERGGDKTSAACSAIERVARRLGQGLATLVNVLDPDVIVLGGMLGAVRDLRAATIERGLAHTRSGAAEPVTLVSGTLPDASLRGAAELALQPLLDDPRAAVPIEA
jgi:predicted NBD/HSP70 family sugar kinase